MSEPKWTSTTTWADLGPDDLPRHHPAHIEVDDKPQQTTAAETELQRTLKALMAAEPDIETLERENADLTRRLAEVTAERDETQTALSKATAERDRLRFERDWSGTAAETARRILTDLGFGDEPSMEPGADPRRDRISALIERAFEAALSRRDEALRVAREAIDELAGLMTSTEAAVLVPGRVPDFEGGYDRCVARARTAQDALDALTKPQEAADAGENG